MPSIMEAWLSSSLMTASSEVRIASNRPALGGVRGVAVRGQVRSGQIRSDQIRVRQGSRGFTYEGSIAEGEQRMRAI
jgi:hypothetical protein